MSNEEKLMYFKNKKFNSADADVKQNNQKLKDELNKKLLETIANQIDFNSENDYRFINKENAEITKLDELNIDDAKFHDLMKLHEFNKDSLIKSITVFKEFDEVNSDTEDNSAINTFLDALQINRNKYSKN